MEIRDLLLQVQSGTMKIDEAEEVLKRLPYDDLDFAKIDKHRALRSGFGEVIFCAGKTRDQVLRIFQSFHDDQTPVLGTRATPKQAELVCKQLPSVQWDEKAGTLCLPSATPVREGRVVVCTGGTSDQKVAEEAAATASFFGADVVRVYDVGVAGIHRLFAHMDEIHQANCVIAIAGMEGALGSVIAGLVDKPVICVPTSVGYGASFGGLSALLTMLNSCAEGIAVVNIDNGFGAGYMAAQINRLAVRGSTRSL